MSYLLSLLSFEPFSKESSQMLCYYINKSKSIQIILAMSGTRCHFKCTVYSDERILFTAPSESHLEIYSSLKNGIQSCKINCNLLNINENPRLKQPTTSLTCVEHGLDTNAFAPFHNM
jgi:hypothetical protein